MKLISMIGSGRVEKLLLLSVSFMIIGCGGGGDSGGDSVVTPSKTMATITNNNAENVLSGTLSSVSATDNVSNLALGGDDSASLVKISMKTSKLGKVASVKLKDDGFPESGTESCAGGGSLSFDGTQEAGGTITFNQCREDGGITLNGTLMLSMNAENIHAELNNFSVKDPFSDIFILSAIVDINENTGDLNMNLTGSISIEGDKTDFEDFTLSTTENAISVFGLLQSSCVGGWIEIQTVAPIVINPYANCPAAGKLIVKGNNSELRTVFNSDLSIQVFLNGTLFKTYASCDELPESCN